MTSCFMMIWWTLHWVSDSESTTYDSYRDQLIPEVIKIWVQYHYIIFCSSLSYSTWASKHGGFLKYVYVSVYIFCLFCSDYNFKTYIIHDNNFFLQKHCSDKILLKYWKPWHQIHSLAKWLVHEINGLNCQICLGKFLKSLI